MAEQITGITVSEAQGRNLSEILFEDVTIYPVIASIGFDFARFYKWALSLYLEGKLEGKINLTGLKEGVFIPYYSSHISQEIQDAVENATENAISGSVDFDSMLSKSF